MFGIKFLIGIILILGGGAAIGVGYLKYKWIFKMIFGKERFQKQGSNTLGTVMYVIGAVLILLGILVIT